MEVPRLGVELDLQLLAYTTATAPQDMRRVCDLHHRSQQRRILDPLSEARGQTRSLMVPSRIRFHCAMTGTPILILSLIFLEVINQVGFVCLFVCLLFRAAPEAYGGSQARGPIRAAAASLRQGHSNARSKPYLPPTPQLVATLDP